MLLARDRPLRELVTTDAPSIDRPTTVVFHCTAVVVAQKRDEEGAISSQHRTVDPFGTSRLNGDDWRKPTVPDVPTGRAVSTGRLTMEVPEVSFVAARRGETTPNICVAETMIAARRLQFSAKPAAQKKSRIRRA